nr:DUF4012 domain-containing protein [Chloroflexota bacterium]
MLNSSRSPRLGCWLLLIVALIVLLVLGYKAVRLWPHVSALLNRAEALRTLIGADVASLSPADMARIRAQLGDTREDLQAIRQEIGFLLPLIERLGWVPRIGHDLAAAPALLETGIHLCDAGWWGLLGLEPLMETLSKPIQQLGQTTLEAALPVLVVSRPRFAEAEAALAQANKAWSRLDGRVLSPRLAEWKARLDQYLPLLYGATRLAQVAPDLLGQGQPVNYLILAQNNHELRPTGGFISGAGMMQFSAGKIVTMTFQDSYAVDAQCDLGAHPPPPEPLREYIWAPALMFRDANWSPDFPTSAAVMTSIYRLCRGVQADGVIAFDLDGVANLLRGLGSVQPEGYPEAVTADTFLQYVAQYWANPLHALDTAEQETGEWWLRRKDFMADLLQAALRRITTAPQSINVPQFGLTMLQSLRSKHLLVYLRNPAAAHVLSDMSWDGALRPWDGDYCLIADANVGFRKVNPHIQQHMNYQVDLSPDSPPRAMLTLYYQNKSTGTQECIAGSYYDDTYQEMMQGCYWDYVRVYVPRGSRLLAVEGSDLAPGITEDEGKTVFSAFLVLAPGASRTLTFHYELPSSVFPQGEGVRSYRLLLQKQAGTFNIPVQVSISGRLLLLDPSQSDVWTTDEAGRVYFALDSDIRLTWVEPGARETPAVWMTAILGLAGLAMILVGLGIFYRGLTTKTQRHKEQE